MIEKHFVKGDRVAFRRWDGKLGAPGTVVVDSDDFGCTRIQYDNFPEGSISASTTERLDFVTDLTAEAQSINYCVEIPDTEKFLKISEGTALDEELMRAGASRIEANGHYGSAYFFTLDANTHPGRCLQIIERHLQLLDDQP